LLDRAEGARSDEDGLLLERLINGAGFAAMTA
jgi:hypothetical protein